MITVNVTFDSDLISKLVNSEDYYSFCRGRHGCKNCPLFYYESCEETFNAIKEEAK